MAAKTTRPTKKRKPTTKQRREQALREARAKGVKPIMDFDKFLEETGDPEPERDSVDDFLALIRTIRRFRKHR